MHQFNVNLFIDVATHGVKPRNATGGSKDAIEILSKSSILTSF